MSIKDYFGEWMQCIDEKELSIVIQRLKILYQTKDMCPQFKDVFNAFKYCPYKKLKVVILGQDPYPNNLATGLAFANPEGTEDISPSLKVIKNSLQSLQDWKNFSIFATDLKGWANQGVLLLNTALTVERNNPGSQTLLWRPFISTFLRGLSSYNTGVIYVLMGEQAKSFKPYIGPYNDIIECNHPSYYWRTNTEMPCVFSEIDKLTINKNNLKINWYD